MKKELVSLDKLSSYVFCISLVGGVAAGVARGEESGYLDFALATFRARLLRANLGFRLDRRHGESLKLIGQ
jgi:hypothetical protein